MNNGGRAYIEVTPECILETFKESDVWTTVVDGVPRDATFVRVEGLASGGLYRLVFESEELDPVPEGAELPHYGYVEVTSKHDDEVRTDE